MKTKIATQPAKTPVRTTPTLPWEVAAFGTSDSEEHRMIGSQVRVYHFIVALAAIPATLSALATNFKRAGQNPRAKPQTRSNQTDRQMYFISR